MWFASQDGLNRYDGYDFTVYTIDTEPPIAGNFTWSLAEDAQGNIWLASQSGATRLDWKNSKSTRFYFDQSNKVNSIYNQVSKIRIDHNDVFISFDGKGTYRIRATDYLDSLEVELGDIQVYYPKQDSLRRYLYNEFRISTHHVLVSDQHLVIDNEMTHLPEGHEIKNFMGEYFEWGNGFFLGTSGGLLYYDFSNKLLTTTCVTAPVRDLLFRKSSDQLFVASEAGLILFDPESQQCLQTIDAGNADDDLNSSLISALYESSNGLLWIGTANGGINLYDPRKDQFKFVNELHGLRGNPVWSSLRYGDLLFIGTDDGLYMATLNATITSKIHSAQAIEHIRKIAPQLLNQRVSALYESEGTLYVGTTAGLLGKYSIKNGKFAYKILPDRPVLSSIIERNDTLWITSHNTLFRSEKSLTLIDRLDYYKEPEKYPTNYYLSSFLSADGTLWFGSNAGFTLFPAAGSHSHIFYDEHTPETSPNHYFITGFFEDHRGIIWMSTFGGGVSKYNRKTQTFTHLTTRNGLINNTCSAILGNDTHVFVGTNSGLSAIEIDSERVTNYTATNGLLSDEFAICSASTDGESFYWGVVNGLIAFNASILRGEELTPPIVVGIEVNYVEQPYSKIDHDLLVLNPADQIFTLSFADPSFRNQDKITYEYRLEGFNEEWVKTNSGNRHATYSLDPGSYSFELRTVLNGTVSASRKVTILKHPAFYETWWFLVTCILFGGVIVVLISRYFSHQALKDRLRKLEVQQKVQEERERISKDLHDNVGSQITYIATSIDNLSENATSSEIQELGDFTRDTMRQLRETIWVINHDEVTLSELRTKVLDYLAEVLKPHPQVRHAVSFPPMEQVLNPTIAINLFRIIQEAINNSLKHAEASLLKVEMTGEQELELVVEDNGNGFDGGEKSGHYGLLNMQSRAQEIHAQLTIKGRPGDGTVIKVSPIKIGQMA